MSLQAALAELFGGPAGYVLSAVLGALFGSFANVCIVRLPPSDEHPNGQSVVSPGSRCGSCGAKVSFHDNIPILSYLWLRGRCRACGAGFSARYLVVEVLTALLFLYAFHYAMAGAGAEGELLLRLHRFGILAALSFTLVVITFIDLDHQLILNKITYPATVLFYLAGLSLPGAQWQTGLWGIAVGYGLIRLISDGYYYTTGREGLGLGDAKLCAMVGALYGWQAVLVTLFLGSLVGSVVTLSWLAIARLRGGKAEAEPVDTLGASPATAPQERIEAEPEASAGAGGRGEADAELASSPPSTLRHTAVPFGPFLAAGALTYSFALPWLEREFSALWTGSIL